MDVVSSIEDDWDFPCVRTLVLVGRTGNGKSATGNSILGAKIFQSGCSSSSVTITSEMKTTVLEDGQRINVIDTPGLFDSCVNSEFIAKEIIRCVSMAGDTIHAFLVVLSVRRRYSKEEEAVMTSLLSFFGTEIYAYMIVVFTGGDELDNDGETLEGYLRNSPRSLKETLSLCENRYVLFDNKTIDQNKKSAQVKELLFHLNTVTKRNGGKPYNNDRFSELKKGTMELQEQLKSYLVLKQTIWYNKEEISVLKELMHEEPFKRILEMGASEQIEITLNLERPLAEECVARVKAEEKAKAAQNKSDDEKRCICRILLSSLQCGIQAVTGICDIL